MEICIGINLSIHLIAHVIAVSIAGKRVGLSLSTAIKLILRIGFFILKLVPDGMIGVMKKKASIWPCV